MIRAIAGRPMRERIIYKKYGFVEVEHTQYRCPRCKNILNAGPNFQPKYCDRCGQKLTFKNITWEDDKEVKRYEPKQDRVV